MISLQSQYNVYESETCPPALVDLFDLLCSSAERKRRSWFPLLMKDHGRYLAWFYIMDQGKIISFSAIQKHFFPDDTVRILTRFYLLKEYRKDSLLTYEDESIPMALLTSSLILQSQIRRLRQENRYKKCIFTMEPAIARNMAPLVIFFNRTLGTDFELLPEKIQTYPGQPREIWQSVAQMNL